MQIFVKLLNGKIKVFNMNENDTVEDLKIKIMEIAGIPTKEQRLIYNCKELRNNRLLLDYNVVDYCTIQLLLRLRGGMKIFVKNLLNALVPIEVEFNDNIKNIKVKIYELEQIPPENQKLLFGQKELLDEEKISDCNINDESVLTLVFTL
ncbi:polyubiquitin 12-like [Centruroides sculpturatus]|uniref:polyubiquitin 12-like n=1 Tax=Centruroides sculpturatus TaxID=218467 RepID=UPI000C6CB762|nr:polyubiquitin 12-like [Centruroides sculpturatus]